MLCPFKFVDPTAHTALDCEPQCGWRAAQIINQTEDALEVYYYCGAISNARKVEVVNIDGPISIPLNQEAMPAPEEETEVEEETAEE